MRTLGLMLCLAGTLVPRHAVAEQLNRQVAADAGSTNAPLLFCIGMHIEPLPAHENKVFFAHQVDDIRRVAGIVEKYGGRMTVQAQTPFTRAAAESGNKVLADLEKRGHEIALHFHEDAHLGRGCERLSVAEWVPVMKEEIAWLKKAGATRIRYWSGGNLFPGVLDAAAQAGLDVMSDHKNPRRQATDERLLGVNPWRPAGGPTADDVAAFARHDPQGKIIYLPDGKFSRVDHAGMRRSRELGGEWKYFDFLTEGLELSLRAARSDRGNVFHITVHAGEFRGRDGEPFVVIEAWLREVVAPLVKAGKVRWATFSQMADEYVKRERTTSASAIEPLRLKVPVYREINTHVHRPSDLRPGEKRPAVLVIGGPGHQLAKTLAKEQRLVCTHFSPAENTPPEFRGWEEGLGHAGQDAIAILLKHLLALPEVDTNNAGLVTFSFGVVGGTGTLARHPDLQVKFLIDWEGPSGPQNLRWVPPQHRIVRTHPASDETFWKERTASEFIKKVRCRYLRVQSEEDHVQILGANQHAIEMLNNATGGQCSWTRCNDNPPNILYDAEHPEQNRNRWLPGKAPHAVMDKLIVKYVEEMTR